MKALTQYLTMNVPGKMGFVNITPQVAQAVNKSGVKEGIVLINSMHITSSVFINDDESGLHHDFGKWLEELAPFNPDPNHYHHNRTGEDNADAHLKRQVMGREVVVAITRGKLDFGPWEQIFYGEFDGDRPKRVLVKIIGERPGPALAVPAAPRSRPAPASLLIPGRETGHDHPRPGGAAASGVRRRLRRGQPARPARAARRHADLDDHLPPHLQRPARPRAPRLRTPAVRRR